METKAIAFAGKLPALVPQLLLCHCILPAYYNLPVQLRQAGCLFNSIG
jgi:hypothetical protein